jgi:phenylalanine-4-hydroxylase
MSRQLELIARLPQHLRAFALVQDYGRYTPRDHAVWRFTLRRLAAQLEHTAHPIYLEGLSRTGISQDEIPNIENMNVALSELGWSAIVVDGFIPPAIFMEFQALRILVIAQDMRPVEHILYTPAPDIVHESAGHAPFIIDTDYAE